MRREDHPHLAKVCRRERRSLKVSDAEEERKFVVINGVNVAMGEFYGR